MNWVSDFYDKQNAWYGGFEDDATGEFRQRAALIAEFSGPGPKRILELGAGGGQAAAAAADLGHDVVAIELVPSLTQHIQQLAQGRQHGKLTVIEGDFYTVNLDGHFDVVCYWDGFGIGTDDDQRRLLQRVADWLTPAGCALIDIYTPWYAASTIGRGGAVGGAERQYDFDGDGCRWLDKWWPKGKPEAAVQQSLRCYAPADLRLLLESTDLTLQHIEPGGGMDWAAGQWLPVAPLERAMKYVAQLKLIG